MEPSRSASHVEADVVTLRARYIFGVSCETPVGNRKANSLQQLRPQHFVGKQIRSLRIVRTLDYVNTVVSFRQNRTGTARKVPEHLPNNDCFSHRSPQRHSRNPTWLMKLSPKSTNGSTKFATLRFKLGAYGLQEAECRL
jgi:hypothetical protein